jgi:hypothetical protein
MECLKDKINELAINSKNNSIRDLSRRMNLRGDTSLDVPVGTSHMSDIRQMSVAMQRLVDFISMVTNSTLLRNNTGAVTTLERKFDFSWEAVMLTGGLRRGIVLEMSHSSL